MASAGAFLFFLAYAIVVTRPLAFRAATQTLIGPDPLSHLWMVSWLTGHAFDPGQIFHGNIFHPAAHAVLFTDLSMGTAVLVLPLRLFTTEPLVLFNAATILALAFGGWAFHALVHGLTGHRWAGLLAGVLAAFSSHQMSHVYHLNLLSTGWLALFLLGLHRIACPRPRGGPGMERGTIGAAVLAGVSFALTAQSSGYYGVAAVVIALVWAAFHFPALPSLSWGVLRRTPQTPRLACTPAGAWVLRRSESGVARRLACLLGAAAIAVLLTLPYLLAFRALQEEQGIRRPPGMSVKMAFHPSRDLTSRAHVYIGLLGGDGEALFPGLLPLVLGGVAVLRRGREAWFYAAGAAVLMVLSLGPEVTLGSWRMSMPYQWLFALPPFDSMRHPFTFASVALFLLAVLAGLGWARLGLAGKPWAGPAVVLLAIAETMTDAPRLREIPAGLPPAYQILQTLPPGPILEVPVFAEESVLWAARHGRPVLNGIGAFAPAQTMVLDRYIRNHWLARVPEDVDTSRPTLYLRGRFPVRYLIIPIGRTAGLRPLAAAFDRSSLFRFVAEAPDGDRIYELEPAR
jgi:hypothetical protein